MEFGEKTIGKIKELIGEGLSRTRLSQEVCRILEWKNAAGSLKEMSCRVALSALHDKGEIVLPEARVVDFTRKTPTVGTEEVVSESDPVEGLLPELGMIEVQRVGRGDKALSRIWFDLMVRHHYLGHGTLCGAQVRYLVRSSEVGPCVKTIFFTLLSTIGSNQNQLHLVVQCLCHSTKSYKSLTVSCS